MRRDLQLPNFDTNKHEVASLFWMWDSQDIIDTNTGICHTDCYRKRVHSTKPKWIILKTMWKSTREYKKVKRKYNFINSKEYRRYFGASAMQDRYNYEDDGIKRRKKEGGRPTARWADQVTMVIQIQREITKVLSNDRWQSSNSLTRDNRTASPPPPGQPP